MREISHVYRTTCTTVTQPPGLGDYLRGSIALAILSYEKGFTLHLDLSHHPIGRYLIRNPSFSTHTTEITEFFNDRVSLLPDYIDQIMDGQHLALSTHLQPDITKINEHVRKTISEQFVFSEEIDIASSEIIKSITNDKYIIFHIRVSDDKIHSKYRNIPDLYSYLEKKLIPEWGNKIIVLSNNAEIKQVLSTKYSLPFINTGSVHLGSCDSKETDIRDTIIDFALMSNASAIYSWSEYSWTSGFSTWCACIFNIPYHSIRIKPKDFSDFFKFKKYFKSKS